MTAAQPHGITGKFLDMERWCPAGEVVIDSPQPDTSTTLHRCQRAEKHVSEMAPGRVPWPDSAPGCCEAG